MSAVEDTSDRFRSAGSLARLTPLGWRGSLVAIFGGLALSFFLFGFWNPYWRIADQDLLLIYDALLQNSGLPREVVYHPAHLSVLALSSMFRLLHDIGFLHSYSLATLPPASDAPAFDRTFTQLVHVARLISLAIVFGYLAAFGALISALTRDRRIVILGIFALAFSGGIAMSVRSVKPELLSGSLAALSLLVLLIAARSARIAARPLLVGAAALIATLAFDNKVQAIFVVAALPVLLLPFGEISPPDGYWRQRRSGLALAGIIAAALLAAVVAAPLVREGLFPPLASGLTIQPIFGTVGLFQVVFAAWLCLGMLVFAGIWKVPPRETVASMAAVIGGIALGLLPLYIAHETQVVAIVINPIESLYRYVSGAPAHCSGGGCGLPFELLWRSLRQMAARHTFFLHTSSRPEIFLEWAVIAATVLAYRRGERKAALQAALLIATVLGIDTLQAARELKQDYFNYTDPLIIIAAVLLLARVPALQLNRFVVPIGALLIALHIVFSQAEPIKHALLLRAGPEQDCAYLDTLRHLKFPFCVAH